MSRNSDFVENIFSKVRNLGSSDDDIRQIINLLLNWDAGHFPSNILTEGLVPSGYTITKDVLPSEFKVRDLEIATYMKGDKKFNLGLADAKYIVDNQSDIAVGFRDKRFIFPGTQLVWNIHNTNETYRNFHGWHVYPSISFNGNIWCVYFCDSLSLTWNTYHILRCN